MTESDNEPKSRKIRGHVLEAMFMVAIVFLVMEAVLTPRILFDDWEGLLAAVCMGMALVGLRAAIMASKERRKSGGIPRFHGGVPSIFIGIALLSLAWIYFLIRNGLPDLFSGPIQALFVLAAIGINLTAAHYYSRTMYFFLANRQKTH